ncbi:50S ribosomal protein L3 [bacterium]|jgi:large subunit ribosomal protein L3|nr:50S ribosomal protein L3 [bacterium]
MKLKVLGRKIGMTQIIESEGTVVPVSIVEIISGQVLVIKSEESDGYESVVIGYQDVEEDSLIKPRKGYFQKLNISPKKIVRESRTVSHELSVGDEIGMGQINVGDSIDVQGKTIGKGFAGVIKRHGFACGPMSHGSKSHRRPGSIGGGTDPGRVWKGKKMAGRMGNKFRTIRNLTVASKDIENNVLFIKGSVPGKKGNLLVIKVESNGN